MIPYPSGRDERGAIRLALTIKLDDQMRAEGLRRRTWLSIKCREDEHGPEGCQNDGTTCLCHCHDPKRNPLDDWTRP